MEMKCSVNMLLPDLDANISGLRAGFVDAQQFLQRCFEDVVKSELELGVVDAK